MTIARPHGGARFRLFPEYAAGYFEPETVQLSLPPGSIGPGPADTTMYVANAIDKQQPFAPSDYMPPWRGPVHPPALPDARGNFDWIPVESDQFMAAHLYGAIRFTLDVWERYLGRVVHWWHADFLPVVELIPDLNWPNAHSGPGFIETGAIVNHYGRRQLLCLNFDVVGHETGHSILFSQLGVPPPDRITSEYLALQESFSDLIGMIAALEFRSVARRLLNQTGGNLYVLNLVNRLGAISDHEQIRIASNTRTMADVQGLRVTPDGSWIDPLGLGRNQHQLAEPLTGAIFDCFVEIYQDRLVDYRLVPPDRDTRGWTPDEIAAALPDLMHLSRRDFARFEQGFILALDTARDVVGQSMAHVILTVPSETLDYDLVAARFLEAAAALGQAHHLTALLEHFLWRGIDPRRYLEAALLRSVRRRGSLPRRVLHVVEPVVARTCVCCHPADFIVARRLMPHSHRMAVGAVQPTDPSVPAPNALA
jgi:hypothetical protein